VKTAPSPVATRIVRPSSAAVHRSASLEAPRRAESSSKPQAPPGFKNLEAYIANHDDADAMALAFQQRPSSALRRYAPRSKVAVELFDKLKPKSVDDFCGTPAFAMPSSQKAEFLEARRQIVPAALLAPRDLLRETKSVASAALGNILRWQAARHSMSLPRESMPDEQAQRPPPVSALDG
jgi:hypothetical protein